MREFRTSGSAGGPGRVTARVYPTNPRVAQAYKATAYMRSQVTGDEVTNTFGTELDRTAGPTGPTVIASHLPG